jgi:hypothetical protein
MEDLLININVPSATSKPKEEEKVKKESKFKNIGNYRKMMRTKRPRQ